jgi:hypothetical protein
MGEAIVFIINSNFAFSDGNPSATADGTDCFQVAILDFEAKLAPTRDLIWAGTGSRSQNRDAKMRTDRVLLSERHVNEITTHEGIPRVNSTFDAFDAN